MSSYPITVEYQDNELTLTAGVDDGSYGPVVVQLDQADDLIAHLRWMADSPKVGKSRKFKSL